MKTNIYFFSSLSKHCLTPKSRKTWYWNERLPKVNIYYFTTVFPKELQVKESNQIFWLSLIWWDFTGIVKTKLSVNDFVYFNYETASRDNSTLCHRWQTQVGGSGKSNSFFMLVS